MCKTITNNENTQRISLNHKFFQAIRIIGGPCR